jgi:hypothetical protein
MEKAKHFIYPFTFLRHIIPLKRMSVKAFRQDVHAHFSPTYWSSSQTNCSFNQTNCSSSQTNWNSSYTNWFGAKTIEIDFLQLEPIQNQLEKKFFQLVYTFLQLVQVRNNRTGAKTIVFSLTPIGKIFTSIGWVKAPQLIRPYPIKILCPPIITIAVTGLKNIAITTYIRKPLSPYRPPYKTAVTTKGKYPPIPQNSNKRLRAQINIIINKFKFNTNENGTCIIKLYQANDCRQNSFCPQHCKTNDWECRI